MKKGPDLELAVIRLQEMFVLADIHCHYLKRDGQTQGDWLTMRRSAKQGLIALRGEVPKTMDQEKGLA